MDNHRNNTTSICTVLFSLKWAFWNWNLWFYSSHFSRLTPFETKAITHLMQKYFMQIFMHLTKFMNPFCIICIFLQTERKYIILVLHFLELILDNMQILKAKTFIYSLYSCIGVIRYVPKWIEYATKCMKQSFHLLEDITSWQFIKWKWLIIITIMSPDIKKYVTNLHILET